MSNPVSASEADAVVARVARSLRKRGGRMTHSRRAVLTALAQNPGHWTNDEVEAFVADIDPTVHRSSVYRTLETLSQLGAILHVHVGHGNTVFRLAADGEDPLHVQCRHCGQIIQLEAGALDGLRRQLEREHGFVLHADHTALSGICAKCQDKAGHDHGHSH